MIIDLYAIELLPPSMKQEKISGKNNSSIIGIGTTFKRV
jgi:hypothetical protein